LTGLWAALHAKADDPGRDVVVLEADTVGFGAGGRNGGFLSYSLTYGIANGLSRFEDEMPALERLGMEHFDGLRADLATHGIDCGTAHGGRVAYAVGYTGLGVGASRFGARVGPRPPRRPRDRGDAAALRAPPSGAVPARAAALGCRPAHAQPPRCRRPAEGRRGLWLRTLDRLGLGFDS
jgi:hypothetical protein